MTIEVINMKKIYAILLLVSLLTGIVIFGAMIGTAQSVTLSAGTLEAASESEVDIPITVQGATGIGAVEMVLIYDAAILEAKSVDKGALLTGNSLLEFNSEQAGRLGIALVTIDQVKGDGVLLNAHFLVRGKAGQKSALRLENARAWEGENRLDVLVKTEAGEFTVSSGFPWWLLALVALILVILAIVIIRRRQGEKANRTG